MLEQAWDSASVYGLSDVFRTADGQLVSYREVVGANPAAAHSSALGGQLITIRTGL